MHSLVLSGPAITDTSLEHVASARGLIALELERTAITSEGMYALAPLRLLQHIRIDGAQINDNGIEVFREWPQLARVEILNAPNITSGCFTTFRRLLALRRLHMQNTAITIDQLRQLDRDLSSCAVTPL